MTTKKPETRHKALIKETKTWNNRVQKKTEEKVKVKKAYKQLSVFQARLG
jgi:hypothetical protein